MDLRLVVEDRGRHHAVAVDAAAEHTVGDLQEALSRHLHTSVTELHDPRSGRRLDPHATLLDVGLVTGQRLTTSPVDLSPRPDLELVVVSGPSAGSRHPVPRGRHVLGRSSSADIRIEDPFISREHAELVVDRGGGAQLRDLGSANGVALDGQRVVDLAEVAVGATVQAGASLLELRIASDRDPMPVGGTRAGIVPFNRPPRVLQELDDAAVTLPAPPSPQDSRRLPMSAALAPLAFGAVGAFLFDPRFLVFAALSPLMALWSWVEDRRSGRKEYEAAREQWRAELAEADASLAEAAARETEIRRRMHPDLADLSVRALGPRSDLWERRPEDEDFLDLRLGWGRLRARRQLEIVDGGDEDLHDEALEVADRRGWIEPVGIPFRLRTDGPLGITGPTAPVQALGRSIVTGLATMHSPRDVVLALLCHPDRRQDWSWATWLPHVTATTSPLQGLQATATSQEAAARLDEVASIIKERSGAGRGSAGESMEPAIVMVIDGDLTLPRETVADILRYGPAAGVFAVWLGTTRSDLPGECRAVVSLDGPTGEFSLLSVDDGDELHGSGMDGLSLETARGIGLALAPIRDVSARGATTSVPRTVPLFDVHELAEPSPTAVISRWQQSEDLGAVIGATGRGPLRIDLRHDGPHALIGGTTGSGKSELLQSLVASMALDHPPSRCTFLLVDYKGGAAFKDCVDLPHTVGFVTDLDGHLVHRALLSLNAELKYRERVLHEHDAKDLIELEDRHPAAAPANLVIVVDEFATLVKELPDFVAGVVDVAQRGRSLGIHLVLATQRPAGSINDNIRANTNLRIALRMNDATDSQDVLNDAAAARIPRSIPGRAYARMGPSELIEFQSAYVGGRSVEDSDASHVVVHDLDFGRRVEASRSMITADLDLDARSDLERIVAVATEAATQAGARRPRAPWLPPLDVIVDVTELPSPAIAGRQLVVGMLDDPKAQSQHPWTIDLDEAPGLLALGGLGSGTSTLLRSLAVAAATTATTDAIHVYGLDFDGGSLDPLRSLPHVGAIIRGDEVRSVQKLFRLLDRIIDERRNEFTSAGVSSFAEYSRATGSMPPRIVLMLDGYEAFAATFERIDYGALIERLPRLVSDGAQVGITTVVTAQRSGAVPVSLQSALPDRLVLRMADPDEYFLTGLPREVVPGDATVPDGRAFLRDGREVQIGILGSDPAGEVIGQRIRDLGAELSETVSGARPRPIRQLPTEVVFSELPAPNDPRHPVVGLGGDDVEAVALDLESRHVLVVGPPRSGRSTTLATIARSIAAAPGPRPRLVLLAPRPSPLTSLDDVWADVASGTSRCEDVVEELLTTGVDSEDVLLFVDDAEDLNDTMADEGLSTLVKRGQERGVAIVAAAETASLHRTYGGYLPELRKGRQGILLAPDPMMDGDLLGIDLPRSLPRSQPPGRGFAAVDGGALEVQVAAW